MGLCLLTIFLKMANLILIQTIGKETVITNGVTIGSGVTLLPIVISATDVVIGAGAVVTKDITQSGVYFGNPAKINSSL